MIYGPGMLEMGMIFNYGQLVIDDEIAAMVKRVVGGFSCDRETMGVELIKEVGIGGNFLNQRHTMDYLKQEQTQTKLFDRRMRGAWEKRGSKRLDQVATEKARDIIATHRPLPLGDGVEDEIKKIVAAFEKKHIK